MNELKGLNEISKEVYKGNKERGFWDEEEPNTGQKIMLMVCELSEAVEADRAGRYADLSKDRAKQIKELYQDGGKAPFISAFHTEIKDTFEDEMADTFIRLLDFCGRKGIDIESHIRLKLLYNSTRAHKHGKKY